MIGWTGNRPKICRIKAEKEGIEEINIGMEKRRKRKMSAAPGIPSLSPTQVRTRPDDA